MKCPNCGHDDNEVRQKDYDKSFMMKSNIRTRQCNRCGWYFDTEEEPITKPYRKKDRKRIYKGSEGQASFFDED